MGSKEIKTRLLGAIGLAAILTACSDVRETLPARAASEQLLLSVAADRAADALGEALPPGHSIFLDSSYFDALDGKYAIASIRDSILRHGGRLTADRKTADMVVEIRSGALSIDKRNILIGIPSLTLPVPLTPQTSTPEIAFYKSITAEGVAKFAAIAYDSKEGTMLASTGPLYGLSHHSERQMLFFLSWTSSDIKHEEADRAAFSADELIPFDSSAEVAEKTPDETESVVPEGSGEQNQDHQHLQPAEKHSGGE